MPENNNPISLFVDNLSDKNKQLLETIATQKTYKKNTFLLKPGRPASSIFIISKGITRNFIRKSDKEITLQFSFENEIVFPQNSYQSDGKSDEYIQTLTDTEVEFINLNEFNRLKNGNPELLKFEISINEFYMIQMAQRLRDFQTLNATERYLQLIEKEPKIIKYIPLTYIASYLGITLGSLSRIRGII